jgi:two-component system invasion response regulator UvrY
LLKVLIADDHAIVRKGLKEILRERPEPIEIGEAGDGQSVLNMVDADTWDILVLDISMPRLNGLEVLRRIKLLQPDLPVLMLSMHSAAMYIQQSLKLGASGYLSKESAPEELLEAIDAARSGRIYISHALQTELGRGPGGAGGSSASLLYYHDPLS